MSDPVAELFEEFRHDHQIMGRGLFEVAAALRAGDDQQAAEAARALDRVAGPHIRFEELYFYPELRSLLGDPTVERFEAEHREGLAAIGRLSRLKDAGSFSSVERERLGKQIDVMREHTDECGEHFGALGRIPRPQQQNLLTALHKLRREGGLWTEWSEDQKSK